MEALTPKSTLNFTDVWGNTCKSWHQQFVLKKCDIGKAFDNYLMSRKYFIKRSDVGRTINVQADEKNYCYWSFYS